MIKLINISVLIVLLSSCFNNGVTNSNPAETTEVIDASRIRIFQPEGIYRFKDMTGYKMTNSDLEIVEDLLRKCVRDYNIAFENELQEENTTYARRQLRRRDFVIDLNNYIRLYVPILGKNGEKGVSIDCRCLTTGAEWNPNIVIKDGGDCFFKAYINITKKEYSDLYVNGIG